VLPTFLASGFAPFQGEYEAASVLLGRRVTFVEGGVGGGPALRVAGVVAAIGGDGRLYIDVEGTHGGGVERRGFLSGEVSGIELAPGNVVSGAEA
jgi:hypothetical protein